MCVWWPWQHLPLSEEAVRPCFRLPRRFPAVFSLGPFSLVANPVSLLLPSGLLQTCFPRSKPTLGCSVTVL